MRLAAQKSQAVRSLILWHGLDWPSSEIIVILLLLSVNLPICSMYGICTYIYHRFKLSQM